MAGNWGGARRGPTAHVNHLGNPLWEYRVEHRMTQRQLADAMYMGQQSISDMERGKTKLSEYVKDWLKARGYEA